LLDIKGLKSGAAVNNRLEEAYIVFTLWVAEGFFGDISPKREQIWMKPGIQMWDHSVHSHKKMGKSPQGFRQMVPKPCTGHPTHSTPTDYGTGTDTGL